MQDLQKAVIEHGIKEQMAREASVVMQRIMTNTAAHPCPFCGWQPKAGIIRANNLRQDLVLPPQNMCPIHAAMNAQRGAMERMAELINAHTTVASISASLLKIYEDTSKSLGIEHDAETLEKLNGDDMASWSAAFQEILSDRLTTLDAAILELRAKHDALPPQFKSSPVEATEDGTTGTVAPDS